MKRIDLAVMAVVALAACFEQPTSTVTWGQRSGSTRAGVASPPGDYIATPAGYYHRSCVHEIPRGAQVDSAGLVTRGDGSRYQVPTCQHLPRRGIFGLRRAALAPQAGDSNWIEWASDSVINPNRYVQLSARWIVPSVPEQSFSSGQVYYAFPGLMSEGAIIQPVIQYGYNEEFGGNLWEMASWWCNAYDYCLYSTPDTIAAGDTIVGSIVASNCGVQCTWTIKTKDITSPRVDSTTLQKNDTKYYRTLIGGAVEEYEITACEQYPDTGVFFTNIAATDTFWTVSPNWTNVVNPDHYGPSCDFSVSSGLTSVNLYHNLVPRTPLSVTMSGPSRVKPNDLCTWTAIPSGGVRPISYSWVPRGSQLDSTVTESFSSSDTLTVYAWDSANQSAQASKSITVAQNAPSCPRRPRP